VSKEEIEEDERGVGYVMGADGQWKGRITRGAGYPGWEKDGGGTKVGVMRLWCVVPVDDGWRDGSQVTF
jgi:hypothetical protein